MTSLCPWLAPSAVVRHGVMERALPKFTHCPLEDLAGFDPSVGLPKQVDGFCEGWVPGWSGSGDGECYFEKGAVHSIDAANLININGRCPRIAPVSLKFNHFNDSPWPSGHTPECGALRTRLCFSTSLCHRYVTFPQRSTTELCYLRHIQLNTTKGVPLGRGGSARTQHRALPPCTRSGVFGGVPRAQSQNHTFQMIMAISQSVITAAAITRQPSVSKPLSSCGRIVPPSSAELRAPERRFKSSVVGNASSGARSTSADRRRRKQTIPRYRLNAAVTHSNPALSLKFLPRNVGRNLGGGRFFAKRAPPPFSPFSLGITHNRSCRVTARP